MIEKNGWNGKFDIFIKSGDEWQHDKTIYNMITDIGLNFFRDALRGTITNAEITYIAVGTGSTAVSASDTQLANEIFRKPVYSKSAIGTGALQTIGILTEAEAVANIQEIGIFAGTTASAVVNSGAMISRILYSRNKTNLESIQIQRTDTISRG